MSSIVNDNVIPWLEIQNSSSDVSASKINYSYLYKIIEQRHNEMLKLSKKRHIYTYGNFPEELPSKYNEEIKGVIIDSIIIDDLSFEKPEKEEAKESKELPSFDPKDLDI